MKTGNSIAEFEYVRTAVCAPRLRVADVSCNVAAICDALRTMADEGVALAVFPELCLTGYTCADLFYQSPLLDAAADGLRAIQAAAKETGVAAVVGLPVLVDARLYNCAAVVTPAGLAGIVPKSCLPTTQEYYEERWFARSAALAVSEVSVGGFTAPIGTDLLFVAKDQPKLCLGIEVCEDLWGPEPLSGPLAVAGATVLANLSASNEILGKEAYRSDLVRQQSGRCLAAYLYASAGPGESSTDLVFSGHCLIAECGQQLAETARFRFETQMAVADIDLQAITGDRVTNSTFSASRAARAFRRITIDFARSKSAAAPVRRPVPARPFIPADAARRAAHCREIFAIQSTGLAKRLAHIGSKTAVIGVSGGLDSTLALLVASRSLKTLGFGSDAIQAIVMPGPGSTDRTQGNAERLARALGATCRIIPIGPAVEAHLADIAHPEGLHDATYENAQARERTQILMNLANQSGGIVVGTGDLSELALGWCTYNGDQMSMYHVNAGVPKTLVRHVIEWCADEEFEGGAAAVLRDICATPITPELLPLGEGRSLVQKTEEVIGPYDLHDFFLFHTVRRHCRPAKVYFLANQAFADVYLPEEILRVLRTFYQRFFANQFKRSAMPDGPKVGTVALSPRGDWRMPSDASPALWLAECDAL